MLMHSVFDWLSGWWKRFWGQTLGRRLRDFYTNKSPLTREGVLIYIEHSLSLFDSSGGLEWKNIPVTISSQGRRNRHLRIMYMGRSYKYIFSIFWHPDTFQGLICFLYHSPNFTMVKEFLNMTFSNAPDLLNFTVLYHNHTFTMVEEIV